MKTWIYTSNDRAEMELVSELLNDHGIAATIGEFAEEPEFAGELAVLIDGERYEDAERIVKVFYEQRDQLQSEAKSRRAWARSIACRNRVRARRRTRKAAAGTGNRPAWTFQSPAITRSY